MIRHAAVAVAAASLLWGCEGGKKNDATLDTPGQPPANAQPNPSGAPNTDGMTAAVRATGALDDGGTTTLAGAAQRMGADAGVAAADAGTAGAGAGGATGATASAGISPESMKAADEIFTQRCVTCHGAQGKGDGPASAALNPKPRAFGDPEWQKSVTDEHIEKVIAQGGPAVGKSPLMPPNPDLAGKPVIQALRAKVRGFATTK